MLLAMFRPVYLMVRSGRQRFEVGLDEGALYEPQFTGDLHLHESRIHGLSLEMTLPVGLLQHRWLFWRLHAWCSSCGLPRRP